MKLKIDEALCIRCGLCARACPRNLIAMGLTGAAFRANQQEGCFGCAHCVAACPQGAVQVQEEVWADPTWEGEIERQVKMRRSIRHYRAEIPQRALIEKVLDAAEWAPSASNRRLHRWTVLLGRTETDWVAGQLMDWAETSGEEPRLAELKRAGTNLVTCGAPCLLLCHGPEGDENCLVDAAIAAETVELLLAERGLASCWAGWLRRLYSKVPSLVERFALPQGHRVLAALMVGYPDGERYAGVPPRKKAEPRWI
jgi:nitroreductase/NAD-dependent dihydropyrimidine dehydrogenase PreA subunit